MVASAQATVPRKRVAAVGVALAAAPMGDTEAFDARDVAATPRGAEALLRRDWPMLAAKGPRPGVALAAGKYALFLATMSDAEAAGVDLVVAVGDDALGAVSVVHAFD
ncbi:Aste57867_12883 [Aphanomyces stellatus]|uniref:Aste57867_12883 protein n=1 Tax=Aphanomyces stellatus TaxID=120398 RepID=A0A485KXI8_9STRA|nr:hypothetical protein As57867_012835 [Aphanomyces stellatus]VFT89730.1 Aste57867_12883 [Aphanomyces stellatus]